MEPAAVTLARYAASLRYEDIPEAARIRARQCFVDTIGVCLLGARLPWGEMVAAHAREHGRGGASRLVGVGRQVHAPLAALANGVFAHGFELDSLRQPGAGVHPGSALIPALLAMGDACGAGGRDALTAFVAACEVLFRIGKATKHSSEGLGFHAPGLTGPFGAAIAAGRMLHLDAAQLTNALGIAGSLCGGLLAFNHSRSGSMVKRLHLGRAAEAGVLAASLAARGYEGPETILEGHHGFLEAYCESSDPALLTRGLGSVFETERICIKRFPCHVTAHTPVQSVMELRGEHGFDGHAVEAMSIRASEKVLSHHSGPEPADVMAAQYSVPFCAAVALFDDPLDPTAFAERALSNPAIRAMASRIAMSALPADSPLSSWGSEIEIRLRDGRTFARTADQFKGTPDNPMSDEELAQKYHRCASGYSRAEELLGQLARIDTVSDMCELALGELTPA